MEFQARQGPWVRGQSPNNGAAKTGGWPSALCAAAGARVCFVWAGLAWRELAQLGWAGLGRAGLDWIGLDWMDGRDARAGSRLLERERGKSRACGIPGPGRVRPGQVRSSAGQQARPSAASRLAGWLAAGRQVCRQIQWPPAAAA